MSYSSSLELQLTDHTTASRPHRRGTKSCSRQITPRCCPFLYTLHPPPCTLQPTPFTLHPVPYTLHLTPCTPHPTPYTLHPTPYTLHPTPYALHPDYPLVYFFLRNIILCSSETIRELSFFKKGKRNYYRHVTSQLPAVICPGAFVL